VTPRLAALLLAAGLIAGSGPAGAADPEDGLSAEWNGEGTLTAPAAAPIPVTRLIWANRPLDGRTVYNAVRPDGGWTGFSGGERPKPSAGAWIVEVDALIEGATAGAKSVRATGQCRGRYRDPERRVLVSLECTARTKQGETAFVFRGDGQRGRFQALPRT
jgi:hypothetical protein